MNWPPASDPRSFESRWAELELRINGHAAQLELIISTTNGALLDIEKLKQFFDLYAETVTSLHTASEEHEFRIQKLEGTA